MKKNYYDELEVSKTASKEVIEKAYKVLAKKYHPDSTTQEDKAASEERFKAISEAYNTLSDDFKRKEYDKELEESSPTISYEEYEYVLNKNRNLEDEIDYLHERMNDRSSSNSESRSSSRSGVGSKYFGDSPRGYYNRFTDSFVHPRASSGSSYTDRTKEPNVEDFDDGKKPKRTFYYSDTGKPASAFDYYVYRIKTVGSNFFFGILVFVVIILLARGILMTTLGNNSNKNTTKNNTQNDTQNTVSNDYIVDDQNDVYSENSIINELTNSLENQEFNPIQHVLNMLNQRTNTTQRTTKKDENV